MPAGSTIDFGKVPGKPGPVNHQTASNDPLLIFGLLELYEATGEKAYLELARRIGDNALATRFHNGFFVESKDHIFSRFD